MCMCIYIYIYIYIYQGVADALEVVQVCGLRLALAERVDFPQVRAYTILYHTILYCTILYYTTLYYTVLY